MENLVKIYNNMFYDFLYPNKSNKDILLKDLLRLDEKDETGINDHININNHNLSLIHI